MSFYYWMANTMGWINFVGGVALGVIGWRKYGKKLEEIWKNLSK